MGKKQIIVIDEVWSLQADDWNWTVIENIPVDKDHHWAKEDGKEFNTKELFFATLEQACLYILDQDAKVSEDVDDILDTTEECADFIVAAIKKHAGHFPRSGVKKKKKGSGIEKADVRTLKRV